MTHPVSLAVYDLSNGLARQFSQSLVGRQLDGIWHTGVRVYGREFYFGGGVCADLPGATPFGAPREVHPLGDTRVSLDDFTRFLAEVSVSDFSPTSYHLLDNNCNHFSDRCARFLLGARIPEYIRSLPHTAMASPLGPMLRPIIDSMHNALVQQTAGHEWTRPPSGPGPGPTAASPGPAAAPANLKPKPLSRAPVTLTSANVPRIVSRLHQSDPSLPPDAHTVSHAIALVAFVDATNDDDLAFPALDLLRISAARHAHVAEYLVDHVAKLAARFARVDATSPAASIMALRLIVNVFAHDNAAISLLLSHSSESDNTRMSVMLDAASWALCDAPPSTPLRKAAALVLRNVGAARGRVDLRDEGNDHQLEGVVVRALYVAFRWVEQQASETSPTEHTDDLVTNILIEALALLVEGDDHAWLVLHTLGLDVDAMLPSDAHLARDRPHHNADDSLRHAVALLRHMARANA